MKAYQLLIVEIAKNTFNTSDSSFAAQFTEFHERIANYCQQNAGLAEGYLVEEMI